MNRMDMGKMESTGDWLKEEMARYLKELGYAGA